MHQSSLNYAKNQIVGEKEEKGAYLDISSD